MSDYDEVLDLENRCTRVDEEEKKENYVDLRVKIWLMKSGIRKLRDSGSLNLEEELMETYNPTIYLSE